MNGSGNHLCYFNLFQDCGRESRHAPVVSAVTLAFPLRIAAGCVKLISLTRDELLWAEAGMWGSGQHATTPPCAEAAGELRGWQCCALEMCGVCFIRSVWDS